MNLLKNITLTQYKTFGEYIVYNIRHEENEKPRLKVFEYMINRLDDFSKDKKELSEEEKEIEGLNVTIDLLPILCQNITEEDIKEIGKENLIDTILDTKNLTREFLQVLQYINDTIENDVMPIIMKFIENNKNNSKKTKKNRNDKNLLLNELKNKEKERKEKQPVKIIEDNENNDEKVSTEELSIEDKINIIINRNKELEEEIERLKGRLNE